MFTRFLSGLVTGLVLTATPVVALDLNQMTAEERELFREEVRAYLLENPEVIIEAVNRLEERQAQAQAQADVQLVSQHADALFNDGYSYVGGNPDGDITLVEFMDYRCGFCKRAFGEVEKLLENDGNIRFVVKEFPILGEQSVLASRFAIATKIVEGDEAYKQMHDTLMEYQGNITLPALRRLADTFGYDAREIENRMDDEEVTAEIRATRELAQILQISGTPTFVLEDEMLRGFLPADQMQQLVDEKRG